MQTKVLKLIAFVALSFATLAPSPARAAPATDDPDHIANCVSLIMRIIQLQEDHLNALFELIMVEAAVSRSTASWLNALEALRIAEESGTAVSVAIATQAVERFNATRLADVIALEDARDDEEEAGDALRRAVVRLLTECVHESN